MGFGDLKSESGLKTLDAYLENRSYIVGYVPSQADTAVFQAMSGVPNADIYNVLRWYNHIASYASQTSTFPGEKKPVSAYGPEGGSAPAPKPAADDDDDDIDLFGSDDEADEEAEAAKAKLIEAYKAKKSKKTAIIAKSMIVLDVKPWDDETDMAEIEKLVRGVATDGLVWGAGKFVAIGYGIKKLQISCVVEDDKVGTDFLEESITAFEDFVQSVDVAAFNKL